MFENDWNWKLFPSKQLSTFNDINDYVHVFLLTCELMSEGIMK